MLRNKKYGMGGAVQSFSSPMLAQGMQGGLSGFGTSGLQTFAKGGKIGDFAKKNIGKKVKVDFRKEEGVIVGGEGDFVSIHYPTLGFTEGVNTRLENIYFVEDMKYVGDIYYGVIDYNNNLVFQSQNEEEARRMSWNYEGSIVIKGKGKGKIHKYAKGGEIIDQYEGRTPVDIWFNLTKSQRRHLLLDHANIPSGELSSYIGDDTSFDELPHFVKQIVKKHFAEGQYAKGGKVGEDLYIEQLANMSDASTATIKLWAIEENHLSKDELLNIVQGLGRNQINRFHFLNAVLGDEARTSEIISYARSGKSFKMAKGGQIASIGDSGIITDKNSMFVGKMALITGDLGNMYEVRVGERTTIVKKNGIRIISDEYANGGEIHNSAKQMSDEDFEIAYNKLTPSEKNDVKILIRLGDDKKLALASILAESKKPSSSDFYKRAYEYANGGEITHLPEAKKVSKEDIEQFIRYVDSFYGKNGVYADKYEGFNSKAQIRKAVMTYLNNLSSQQTWGGGAGDSLDRERVAQILKPSSKPTYAKGGQTSTYEVHLEAVPNRDFDQSSHEGNVRVPKLKKSAKSVAEAVSIAKKFIQDNDLGGSNFLPAKLYKNGKQIGFISYNGRVWNNDQSEMKYADGGSVGRKKSKFQLGDKVYSFYNPTKSASIVDLYFKAWDTLDNIPHENDTYFYELSLPDGTNKKLAESALSKAPLKTNKSESKNMDVQFIEYKDNEIMYEPTSKKYYANDVEFDSLLKAKKFLDSGKVSSNIRGAYKKALFAKGGEIKPKRSRITLIMDGQKYSYPVALVNGRVEVTEETFKDGVVREYLDKEFDLWLQQAPTDYEEMYYGDEDVMSKSGAIEGAMEIVISTIEQEAPKKMTFNFDEGDVEFYEAYQYEKGGSIDEIKEGDYFINTTNGEKFYIDKIDKKDKNYSFYVLKSKPTDLPEVISIAEWNRFAKNGLFEKVNKKYAKGGEVVQLPPKGELTNRDNLLLKYQKVGSNYEFYIYEPILKKVSGYNQTKYVCKNSDCALKMNYPQFIKYLYSELYLDDKKFAKGGKVGFEGLANKVAKRYVGKKVSKEYQAEYGKIYDAKEAKEVGNKVAGKVYQQQVAKKKIVRKLQRKTN